MASLAKRLDPFLIFDLSARARAMQHNNILAALDYTGWKSMVREVRPRYWL